jgi:hypothetical protein
MAVKRSRGMPSAPQAAGIMMRKPKAYRPYKKEPIGVLRHPSQSPPIMRIILKTILQPGSSSRLCDKVVSLVGNEVRSNRDHKNRVKLEKSPVEEVGSCKQKCLSLDRDTEKEDKVAVLNQQQFHEIRDTSRTGS